jgi:hypothetical protein
MKNLIKGLLLILGVLLISCSETIDDTGQVCSGNCNRFSGKIYTESNIGIPDVEITLKCFFSGIGTKYERIITKSKTDNNGNYDFEAFIKDREFEICSFQLTIDENKIENSITNDFYKPSELVNEVAPRINECFIPGLKNRSQITNIDYKIPYKTTLTVNLNNFNFTSPNYRFGIGNRIEYGFQTGYNRFLTKQSTDSGFGFANGTNTIITVPSVFGQNYFRIIRFKNSLDESTNETVLVNNPNTNLPINYTY